jgi:hypothetical protein
VAINGTSWLGFRRTVRVRFGTAIPADGRVSGEAVAALTDRTGQAIRALIGEYPDPSPPGRLGRWLTELFNDWPDGARPERNPGERVGRS